MTLSLLSLLRPFAPRTIRRGVRRDRSSSGRAAWVDRLEDRTLLTVYVVDSVSDTVAATGGVADGRLTLREAVEAANTDAAFGDAAAGSGRDIIRFDQTVFGVAGPTSIVLRQGDLRLLDDVTIDGGNLGITIDGQARTRHLRTVTGTDVTIQGLRFFRGRAAVGGSILSQGTLSLDGVRFESNTALGGIAVSGRTGGGAVFATTTVRVEDSVFERNRAFGQGAAGGAILLTDRGRLVVSDTDFLTNRAQAAGGAVATFAPPRFSVQHEFENVLAVRNRAGEYGPQTPPDGLPGDGGFLYATNNPLVRIDQSRIVENLALNNGGAVWVGPFGRLLVDQTRFTSNAAGTIEGDGAGGAIWATDTLTEIASSRLNLNQSIAEAGEGGAIRIQGGSTFIGGTALIQNSAQHRGGALSVSESPLTQQGTFVTIDDSLFDRNETLPFIFGSPPPEVAGGGAIAIVDAGLSVLGTRFADNQSRDNGGAILAIGAGVTAIDSAFVGNAANGEDGIGDGGAIDARGDVPGSPFLSGGVSAVGTVFRENFARGVGGAVATTFKTTASFDASFLFGNSAFIGGDVFVGREAEFSDTFVAGEVWTDQEARSLLFGTTVIGVRGGPGQYEQF